MSIAIKDFTPDALLNRTNSEIVENLQIFQNSYINASVFEADEIFNKLGKMRSQVLDWNKRLSEMEKNLKNRDKLKEDSNISGELWERYVQVLKRALEIVETLGFVRSNVIVGENGEEETTDQNIKNITIKFVKTNDKILNILNSGYKEQSVSVLKNINTLTRKNLDVIESDIDRLIQRMPKKYTEYTNISKFSQYIRMSFYYLLFIGMYIHHENYLNIITAYKDLQWLDIVFRIVSGSLLANFRLNPFTHFKLAELTRNSIVWILKNIPLVNIFMKSGENSFLLSNTFGYLFWALWPMMYDMWMFSARLLILTRAVIVTRTLNEYVNVIYDRYVSGLTIHADITEFFHNLMNSLYLKIKNSMYSEVSAYFDPRKYMGKISQAYCNNIDIALPYNLCNKQSELAKEYDSSDRIIFNFKAEDIIKKSYDIFEIYLEKQNENQILTIDCDDSCRKDWDNFEKILAKNMEELGFREIYQETYKTSPLVTYGEYINTDSLQMNIYYMIIWFVFVVLFKKFENNKYLNRMGDVFRKKVVKKRNKK